MKKIGVLLITTFLLIGFLGNILAITGSPIENKEIITEKSKVCTGEVKECPNNSYVSRNPNNNCEFDSCPIEKIEEETEEICCRLKALDQDSTATYEILEKSECNNLEKDGFRIIGINKEIVHMNLCEDLKEDTLIEDKQTETTRIKNLIQNKNRLMAQVKDGECPEKCTCTGSVTKCELNGTREMTIKAGNSGNIIIQVQGINASTQVNLYKAEDGKIYSLNENNETKEIRMLPDQVKEKIKNRIKVKVKNENINLNDDGKYEYQAEKKAKLFSIFPIKSQVNFEIDAETGEVIEISKPKWWNFLVKEEAEEMLMGESCGTVTPGYNNECCQNKGYDIWDSETSNCEFLIA